MKARSLLRARAARRPPAHGYILLFTLGVLLVVAVLALGMSVYLRLDANMTVAEQRRLRDEYLLRGALEYVAARLAFSQEAERRAAGRPLGEDEQRQIWLVGQGNYSFMLDGRELTLRLEDGGLLPDANLLSQAEWTRLFVALGAEPRRQAEALAVRVMRARQDLTRFQGGTGFASLQELLGLPGLPPALVHGDPVQGLPGLKDMVTVGTNLKQLELNQSPLPLFQALGQVGDEKLAELARRRAAGPMKLEEGNTLLEGVKVKLYTGRTGTVRARVGLAVVSGVTLQMHALLTSQGGYYRVSSRYLDPLPAVATAAVAAQP